MRRAAGELGRVVGLRRLLGYATAGTALLAAGLVTTASVASAGGAPPAPAQHTCAIPATVSAGLWSVSDPVDNFAYGNPGDVPVAGNFAFGDATGLGDVGVVRGATWFLATAGSATAEQVVSYGNPGDRPIVGNWTNEGVDGIGVVRGTTWFLRDDASSGVADRSFAYGNPGDVPVVGDWDGDGDDTPGVFRNGTWFLRNSNTAGVADVVLAFGNPGDAPVAGDWATGPELDEVDTIGVRRGATFFLRDTNTTGIADHQVGFGAPGDVPVILRAHCNGAPTAVDDAASVEQGGSSDIDVLANDLDADGDPLEVTAVGPTSDGGTASITDGGALVSFDPGADFADLDPSETATTTFAYTVDDGNGGTDEGSVTVTVRSDEVAVQVLALNDFHGNLLPPTGSSGRVPNGTGGTVDAGGAEYLATHIQQLEAEQPNSIVVSAGDLVGASPLLSALFHDEPTVEAMNEIGLDINAVGNHEFDEGSLELLRLANGGCHPEDGCFDEDGFAGADFEFLAANVEVSATGDTLFPGYSIREFDGARVAFIGLTLEGTPIIVSASGIQGLQFHDEVETINDLVPEIQAQGVEAIVVLLHEGALPSPVADVNGCANLAGPVVDIAAGLDDAVDLLVSGHTHQPYNCVLDGLPVTSAFSFGRVVTDIDMTVDRATDEITGLTINNKIVTRTVPADAGMTALIARYTEISAPIANRVIGSITADINRTATASGELPAGLLIADAQLAATQIAGAQIAFMNAGGVRGDLVFSQSSGGEAPGQVTFGEAFTVQPFGNILQTVSMTGAQIASALNQQFCGINATTNRILQPSAGFSYTWTASAPCGSKITEMELDGVPIDPAATYRVTISNFLGDGGDGFPEFLNATNRVGGLEDLQAFEAYITANSPVAPPATGRITRLA